MGGAMDRNEVESIIRGAVQPAAQHQRPASEGEAFILRALVLSIPIVGICAVALVTILALMLRFA